MLGNTLSKVFDVINKFLAFAVLLSYALFAINSNWTFITNGTILEILQYLMYYGPICICGLVLVEFALKRNIIIQIVIYALIALVVVFQFFPETFNSIISGLNLL